jgi:MFS family permease
MKSIGIDVLNWGVMVSIFGAAMISTEALWGFLSDRVGKETVIIIGMLSLVLISPSYSLFAAVPLLIGLQLARGAVGVAAGPASRALISDLSPAGRVGTNMGMWYTTSTTGQIIGTLTGSYVASLLGFPYALYLSALSSLIGVGLVIIYLRGASVRTGAVRLPFNSMKHILSINPLRVAFALAVILLAGNTLITAFLPLFANYTMKASTQDIGLVLAVFSSVSVATTLLLGRLSDMFGRIRAVGIGLIICLVSYLGYPLADTLPLTILSTAGAALGFSIAGPSLLAYLTDEAGKNERGTAIGVYGVFEDVGITIAPLLYGYAWAEFGVISIFYVGAALMALGIALIFLARAPKEHSV